MDQPVLPPQSPQQGKRIITISAKKLVLIVSLLMLVIALGVALYLVRQQQELRKEAYPSYNVTRDSCGWIEITRLADADPQCPRLDNGGQNFVTSHTFNYTIKSTGAKPGPLTVNYTAGTNFCDQPKGDQRGTECHARTVRTQHTITLQPGEEQTISMSRSTEYVNADGSPQACGSYQTDLIINSINGNEYCSSSLLAASLCHTGIACVPRTPSPTPTPTPTPPPTPTPSPTPTPPATPNPTPSPTPPPTPTPSPTPTPTPYPTPVPQACGYTPCSNDGQCNPGLVCVQTGKGGYCSMPEYQQACKDNPSVGSCCYAPTPTPTPTPQAQATPKPTLPTAGSLDRSLAIGIGGIVLIILGGAALLIL